MIKYQRYLNAETGRVSIPRCIQEKIRQRLEADYAPDAEVHP